MGNYTTKNSDLTQILTIKAPYKRPSRKTHAFPEAKKTTKSLTFNKKLQERRKKKQPTAKRQSKEQSETQL